MNKQIKRDRKYLKYLCEKYGFSDMLPQIEKIGTDIQVVPRIIDKISKKELYEKFQSDFGNYEKYLQEEIPKNDFDIEFDWENYEWKGWNRTNEEYLGIQELEGRVFIGCQAGGDWEYPVYFIVFIQNGKWRAYIPKDGNVYNHDTMRAFGNGNDYKNEINLDLQFLKKLYPNDFRDIEHKNYDSTGNDCEIMWDYEKIKQDIISNIEINKE